MLLAVLPSAAPAHPRARHAAQSAQGLTVRGDQLYAGSEPFVARGVQIVGLVAPPSDLWGKYVAAGQHFGRAELQAAVADHANLVRFQFSEYGLDPASSEYSAAYVASVRSAVELARSLGLKVLVSVQSESAAGIQALGKRCPLPDAGVLTDWNELASMFKADPGVMFELYNEPGLSANAASWSKWLNGGPITYGTDGTESCTAIGMQQLVDQIRADGARNVIVLPGVGGETNLSGVPTVNDPADPSDPQLAYGVHYPNLPLGVRSWDKAFGNLSARLPVIVTEWDGAAITPACTSGSPAQSVELLAYLASKRIGLVGFSFDLPGTIVSDYSYAPTTYSGSFTCKLAGPGPGQILFGDYAAEARAQASGALSGLSGPASWLVSRGDAQRLLSATPGPSQLLFNTPQTLVTGAGVAAAGQLGLSNAVPTATFTNETVLAQRVSSQTLAPGTVAVQYAPRLHVTPVRQLADPVSAFQQAALVAHSHGLLLVGAPSLDMVKALAPQLRKIKLTNKFLQRRIAATAARYSDVYVIQAQSLERRPTRFAAFVREAAAQAVNAHGSVELLAEIRSSAAISAPTAPMLERDLSRAGASVSGYVLDDRATAGRPSDGAVNLVNSFARRGLR